MSTELHICHNVYTCRKSDLGRPSVFLARTKTILGRPRNVLARAKKR